MKNASYCENYCLLADKQIVFEYKMTSGQAGLRERRKSWRLLFSLLVPKSPLLVKFVFFGYLSITNYGSPTFTKLGNFLFQTEPQLSWITR